MDFNSWCSQKNLSKSFACPYTSTALMALIASVQCAAIAGAAERRFSAWELGLDIRLVGALYAVILNYAESVSTSSH